MTTVTVSMPIVLALVLAVSRIFPQAPELSNLDRFLIPLCRLQAGVHFSGVNEPAVRLSAMDEKPESEGLAAKYEALEKKYNLLELTMNGMLVHLQAQDSALANMIGWVAKDPSDQRLLPETVLKTLDSLTAHFKERILVGIETTNPSLAAHISENMDSAGPLPKDYPPQS